MSSFFTKEDVLIDCKQELEKLFGNFQAKAEKYSKLTNFELYNKVKNVVLINSTTEEEVGLFFELINRNFFNIPLVINCMMPADCSNSLNRLLIRKMTEFKNELFIKFGTKDDNGKIQWCCQALIPCKIHNILHVGEMWSEDDLGIATACIENKIELPLLFLSLDSMIASIFKMKDLQKEYLEKISDDIEEEGNEELKRSIEDGIYCVNELVKKIDNIHHYDKE